MRKTVQANCSAIRMGHVARSSVSRLPRRRARHQIASASGSAAAGCVVSIRFRMAAKSVSFMAGLESVFDEYRFYFTPRAEQHHLHTFRAETQDSGDLAMVGALYVRQPQQRRS